MVAGPYSQVQPGHPASDLRAGVTDMALTTESFSTTQGPGGLSSDSNPATAAMLAFLGVPKKATKAGKGSGRGGGR